LTIGAFKQRYARFRFQLINWKYSAGNYWAAKKGKAEFFTWLVIIAVFGLAATLAYTPLQPFFENEKFLDKLGATALGLGAALLGSTAIVASLALFAMQINVERLPHGLFRRLSADSPLLSAFGLAFIASATISILPLVTPVEATLWGIFLAIILTAVTLRLFLFAYRRALSLINPVQQLRIVLEDVSSALREWNNQAYWFSEMLPQVQPETNLKTSTGSSVDTRRAAFMMQNDWGARFVITGIDHCIAVSGRAAQHSDYQVADAALKALVNLNVSYIQSKGKTFFSQNWFIEMPYANDPIVNQSLEQLKRQFRAALSRHDEEHINMLFKTYGDLTENYAQIDYGQPEADPWHASLTIGYLTHDVQSVIQQNLPDCMMQGVRILGSSAITLLNRDKATAIVSIVDKLGEIGAALSIRENHRPATITAVEQLAGLTHHIINTGVFHSGFALNQIRHAVQLTATVALSLPNPPLTSVHRSLLAPYFSSTTDSSLSSSLKLLVNSLLERPADDYLAKQCVINLREWSERTRPMAKSILLLAIEKRSPFVFDILHWIDSIVEVLLAAASAPVCAEHSDLALDEEAERWIQVLSWIPDDAESLDCAATGSATSVMFNIARASSKWKSQSAFATAKKTLLGWALKPARRSNAWHDVEEAMLALAAAASKSADDPNGTALKSQLAKALKRTQIPTAELLLGAAQGLRRSIDDYDRNVRRTKSWDFVLNAFEPKKRRQFLTDLANMLERAAGP